jgi:hypothetical protein
MTKTTKKQKVEPVVESCQNCRFGVDDDISKGRTICRRYPRIRNKIWREWCGEWERKTREDLKDRGKTGSKDGE